MDKSTAERWVTISAVLVAGIYAYRRLTETPTSTTSLKNLIGIGPLPPLGVFATAWGFTFLVLALMTEAAPGLGGAFSILIATSDLLTNSANIFGDVSKQEGITASATTSSPSSQPFVSTPLARSGPLAAANPAATPSGIGGMSLADLEPNPASTPSGIGGASLANFEGAR